MSLSDTAPGLIVLLGSGETLPSSGPTHEYVAQRLRPAPRIAIMETPAGFELNSARVAGRIGQFLQRRLQSYAPQIVQIAARRRETPDSPDAPAVVAPLFEADEIVLGPGSPTYAVRQLRDSLAWHIIQARQRLGATLFLASAAALAFSRFTLPVYEIYKVGEELHWKEGLDFFGAFGWPLTVIPHWNNKDGGSELDTSHCFMGQKRFAALQAQLPPGQVVLGVDEHTSLVIDFAAETCLVLGRGNVTLITDGATQRYAKGSRLPLNALGPFRLPGAGAGIPAAIWQAALAAQTARTGATPATPTAPAAVLSLVEQRAAARTARQWGVADALRDQIAALGWQVLDTPDGPHLQPDSSAAV